MRGDTQGEGQEIGREVFGGGGGESTSDGGNTTRLLVFSVNEIKRKNERNN